LAYRLNRGAKWFKISQLMLALPFLFNKLRGCSFIWNQDYQTQKSLGAIDLTGVEE